MKIASEVTTRNQLNELKSVMKVFMVNNRIRHLAEQAVIYDLTEYFKKAK